MRIFAKTNVDILHGYLRHTIILYTIPLVLTSFLNLFFHASDMLVVGRFAGSAALAAVGASGTTTQFLFHVYGGLGTAINIMISQALGARNHNSASKILHTAAGSSLLLGIIIAAFGLYFSKPVLTLLGTPPEVLPQAMLYLRIYCMGIPGGACYNFLAAALIGKGDTTSPFIILSIAGVSNVFMNLVFVIVFHMGVAGVATATALSLYFSAIMVAHKLSRMNEAWKLRRHLIRIDFRLLLSIFRLGFPASVNGILFAACNMYLQSAINTFGAMAMAGCAASSTITSFIYVSMDGFRRAALTFTGQHYGAKLYHRMREIFKISMIYATVAGLAIGLLAVCFRHALLGLFVTAEEAIHYGSIHLSIMGYTYFLCGMMNVFDGAIRGLGYSMLPTLITFVGIVGFRVFWISTVFPKYHHLGVLLSAFPGSWIIILLIYAATYRFFLNNKIHPKST
ncbi:MAG: MATE family efflux transporter [Oligosphaeraceae bacterium]|nr:MATE family efflux transporter [Oligosphaeraceae bacterium]